MRRIDYRVALSYEKIRENQLTSVIFAGNKDERFMENKGEGEGWNKNVLAGKH